MMCLTRCRDAVETEGKGEYKKEKKYLKNAKESKKVDIDTKGQGRREEKWKRTLYIFGVERAYTRTHEHKLRYIIVKSELSTAREA